MQKVLRSAALVALLVPAGAVTSAAGELKLTIAHGRVTLVAHDVTVRQILEEWARVGQARIINADKVVGPPVTLELHDEPEARALDTVLRSVAGYVVAPRVEAVGASVYDRIMILPTSRPPAVSAPPPTFTRPPAPQPVMPVVEEDPSVSDQTGQPPGIVPPPAVQPYPNPAMPAGMQQPTTSPVPGMPPAPVVPGNPYQTPVPGTRPPGVGGPTATPGPSPVPGPPVGPGGVPVRPGGGPGGDERDRR